MSTTMPVDFSSSEALKMFGSLGVAAVLAYLLIYVVKVTIPKMQDKFDARLQEQQTTFSERMDKQSTLFETSLEKLLARHAERDQAIFDAFLQERREAKRDK